MKKSVITISEDVMSSVVRPKSCFLNDLEIGTTFTVNALDNVKKATKSNKKVQFFYTSDKGGIFKFTVWDFKRFQYNGKSFLDFYVPQAGDISLANTFKVISCEPSTRENGEKIYPLFCYEGYEKFSEIRTDVLAKKELASTQAEKDAIVIPQSAYDALFQTEIKENSVDKYYRTIDIDTPILYYPTKDS